MKKQEQKQKQVGFTIVELLTVLVVVIIIGFFVGKPIKDEINYQIIKASVRADLPLLKNSYLNWMNNQITLCQGFIYENGVKIEPQTLYTGRSVVGLLRRSYLTNDSGYGIDSFFDGTNTTTYQYISGIMSMYEFDGEFKRKQYEWNQDVYSPYGSSWNASTSGYSKHKPYEITNNSDLMTSPLGNGVGFNKNKQDDFSNVQPNKIKSILLALRINRKKVTKKNLLRLATELKLQPVMVNKFYFLIYQFPIIEDAAINGQSNFKYCYESNLTNGTAINYDNTARLEYYKAHKDEEK